MSLPDHVDVMDTEPYASDAWGEWFCPSCGNPHDVLNSRVVRVRRHGDSAEFSVAMCAGCWNELEAEPTEEAAETRMEHPG